jgi:ADP-ribosylglycohydrolase
MEFDSFGNGCIMRLSPVCLYYRNLTKIIVEACDSLATSHEHEKSRRGVIFLSMVYDMIKKGKSKNQIKAFANECNYYVKKVQPFKDVDATVDGTLRAVMNIFISSKSTHEGILKAISLGGDTDTNASIVAEMLSTYYDDLTTDDIAYVDTHLDDFQFETLTKFNKKLSDD